MGDIEKLIMQFRQFGGKFDNAILRHSEEAGFYCCTLDSNKNSNVFCPADLLVDLNDVDIDETGLFIAKPEKYGNKIEFLNTYFAFQFNQKVLNHYSEIKQQIKSLSDSDLSVISNLMAPDLYKLEQYKGFSYEKKRMLCSHRIEHCGKIVIMPFVTFLNYNKNGQAYNIKKDSISISGQFHDEIFAKYNDDDSLMMGTGYNFITDTPFAYSIPLSYPASNETRVIINRNTNESTHIGNGRWRPLVENKPGSVTISWFPLHLEGAPRYPALIARMIAAETNLSAEKLLIDIINFNLHALMPAAFELQKSDNLFAKHISAVAQRQLELIAATR